MSDQRFLDFVFNKFPQWAPHVPPALHETYEYQFIKRTRYINDPNHPLVSPKSKFNKNIHLFSVDINESFEFPQSYFATGWIFFLIDQMSSYAMMSLTWPDPQSGFEGKIWVSTDQSLTSMDQIRLLPGKDKKIYFLSIVDFGSPMPVAQIFVYDTD